MAKYTEPTSKEFEAWSQWVSDRPDNVRKVAERFNPWTLYKLGPDGHRVYVLGFDEQKDGTVTLTVGISGQFNLVSFERNVFGINPDDLTECDLPTAEEVLGVVLNGQEVQSALDGIEGADPRMEAISESVKSKIGDKNDTYH